eukprot:scaffold14920_cov90-Skeletonema_marinoi.AAC.1
MNLMKRMWNNYGVFCLGVQRYWEHEELHCFVHHHRHRQIKQRFAGVAPVPDWADSWSDTATLDLLKSIVLDGEIPSLLIVGAYREDEVPDHHPLAFHIRELEEMNMSITKIKIGNLSVDYVIPLVAEALGMDDDDSK